MCINKSRNSFSKLVAFFLLLLTSLIWWFYSTLPEADDSLHLHLAMTVGKKKETQFTINMFESSKLGIDVTQIIKALLIDTSNQFICYLSSFSIFCSLHISLPFYVFCSISVCFLINISDLFHCFLPRRWQQTIFSSMIFRQMKNYVHKSV